jgi:hypothetical protein
MVGLFKTDVVINHIFTNQQSDHHSKGRVFVAYFDLLDSNLFLIASQKAGIAVSSGTSLKDGR